MLDFLLSSILKKCPENAKFALKLEGCQEASKLDLEVIEQALKSFKS